MNRRTFFRRSLIAAPFAIGATAGYSRYLERHSVEVVRRSINVQMSKPLKVAFISDLHFDPLYEADYLRLVVTMVNDAAPDMILLGGDFMTNSMARFDELVDILRPLTAPLGVFAVLGNHDHWLDTDAIAAGLSSAGIGVLRNRSVALPDREGWFLTGLESFWSGAPDTTPISNAPPTSRHLLLVHEPDPFDTLTDPRIALQISGHTHGGQIRVPFAGAIRVPSWGKKYTAGYFERGERKLYVNRGIGTVGRHFRLNCRPEISLLELS